MSNVIESKTDVFKMRFDEYINISSKEREELQIRASKENREWIDGELAKRKAKWILVCGGQILEYSRILKDYPSEEKFLEVGKKYNRIPLVFIGRILFEE